MSARAVYVAPLPGQQVLITGLGDGDYLCPFKVGELHVVESVDVMRGNPGSVAVGLVGFGQSLVSSCGDSWLVEPREWAGVALEPHLVNPTLDDRPHCDIHVALPEPCPWCSTVEVE